MFKYCFTIITVLILISAQSQPIQKLRIDPAQAYGGTVSEYFTKVEYIPLETNKKSIFGTPDRLVITDSSIVIGDLDTWSILFFDLKGKFLSRYPLSNNFKLGDYWLDIEYQKEANTITTFCYSKRVKANAEQYIFSLAGKLKEKKTVFNDPFEPKFLCAINDAYDLYGVYKRMSVKEIIKDNDIALLKVLNKKTKEFKTIFSINTNENQLLFAFSGELEINKTTEGIYFIEPFDYSLFKIATDTVVPMGKFIFPLKNITSKVDRMQISERYLDSLRKAKNMDLDLVQSIRRIDFFKNKIILNIVKRVMLLPSEGEVIDPLNFMYDSDSKKLISFERITPDASSYFLPTMDGFSSTSGMNLANGYLFSSVSSLGMFAAYNKTKDRNPQYPPILQQYFKTQNRKSNPVIVRMKLKE